LKSQEKKRRKKGSCPSLMVAKRKAAETRLTARRLRNPRACSTQGINRFTKGKPDPNKGAGQDVHDRTAPLVLRHSAHGAQVAGADPLSTRSAEKRKAAPGRRGEERPPHSSLNRVLVNKVAKTGERRKRKIKQKKKRPNIAKKIERHTVCGKATGGKIGQVVETGCERRYGLLTKKTVILTEKGGRRKEVKGSVQKGARLHPRGLLIVVGTCKKKRKKGPGKKAKNKGDIRSDRGKKP